MAVPDYQSFMLPLLKAVSDGSEHTINETTETLAQQFNLTDQDRKELLPSGKQRKFENRINWARTYLLKALLIRKTGRSTFQITERGVQLLNSAPSLINVRLLKQFPEFKIFINGENNIANEDTSLSQEIIEKTSQTPQEVLETSYQNLRQNRAQELLEQIKNSSPKFFENLVIDLLIAMGYGGSKKRCRASCRPSR